MGVLFDSSPRERDPQTLEEVVFQALGAASACWESLEGAGVFQSDRAKTIGDEVIDWINSRYMERPL